jgi:molecular chaperone HtpG
MTKIAQMDGLEPSGAGSLLGTIESRRLKLEKAQGAKYTAEPLAHLPAAKPKMYEQLFALIYDCSTNQVAAKALIDRRLLNIT